VQPGRQRADWRLLVSIRTQDVEVDGRERASQSSDPQTRGSGVPCTPVVTQVDQRIGQAAVDLHVVSAAWSSFVASPAFPPLPWGRRRDALPTPRRRRPTWLAAATVKLNCFVVILLGNGVSSGLVETSPA
jgi:hypothetical protein